MFTTCRLFFFFVVVLFIYFFIFFLFFFFVVVFFFFFFVVVFFFVRFGCTLLFSDIPHSDNRYVLLQVRLRPRNFFPEDRRDISTVKRNRHKVKASG